MLDSLAIHLDPIATGFIALVVGIASSLFLAALRAEGPSMASRRRSRDRHRAKLTALRRARELRRAKAYR
jgi:hypothetical protein